MKWAYVVTVFLLGFLVLILSLAWDKMALLTPAGIIAASERTLMLHATLLMLIVIVPVLALTFFFAWHYRAANTKAVYMPEWEHSKMDELVWWAIPFEIILVLGALTWISTHELDPRRSIPSDTTPLTIQVVALDWKWLFIYPEERIATLNFVELPVGRPVQFHITADAPMNSFWIPQLGGQIYAMSGMVTTIHLRADQEGDFAGNSANYSGDGFAKMKFTARAVPPEEWDLWVASVRQSPSYLSLEEYAKLAAPSAREPIAYWGKIDEELFARIMAKFNDSNKPARAH